MNWETLLCLGDSITIGSRSYLGYPEYCGYYLKQDTRKDWNVINHAVSKFRTIDLLRYVDKHWSHLVQMKPEVISILIGTNDLKQETDAKDFNIAYNQLVLKSRLLVGSSNIILIRIPLLQAGVMLPYTLKMNDLIGQYNEVIAEIATTHRFLLDEMPALPEYFFDGVHLNARGSEEWGKNLARTILSLRNE